jgi:cell division septal protein FtsQ
MQDFKRQSFRRPAQKTKKRSVRRMDQVGKSWVAQPSRFFRAVGSRATFRWPLLWNLFSTDNPRELRSNLNHLLLNGMNVILGVFCLWTAYHLGPQVLSFFHRPPEVLYISENQLLQKEEILAWSGLRPEFELQEIDPVSLAERIQKLPEVEFAEVRREFPNRLHIRVREHQPVAVLDTEGRQFLIDQERRLLRQVKGGFGLPVLTGVSIGKLQPGDIVPDLKLEHGLKFLKSLEQFPELKDRAVATDLSDPTNVQFWVRNDAGKMTSARFGTGAFPDRLERFSVTYQQVLTEHPEAQWMDLRFSDRILAGN